MSKNKESKKVTISGFVIPVLVAVIGVIGIIIGAVVEPVVTARLNNKNQIITDSIEQQLIDKFNDGYKDGVLSVSALNEQQLNEEYSRGREDGHKGMANSIEEQLAEEYNRGREDGIQSMQDSVNKKLANEYSRGYEDGAASIPIIESIKIEPENEVLAFFEDSFINKPLDSAWTKKGTWTFDGEYGLKSDRQEEGHLYLTDFVEDALKYTVEFDVMGCGEFKPIFMFSPGFDDVRLADAISIHKDGIFHQKGSEYISSYARDTKLSTISLEKDKFYRIKIDISNKNQQVDIYIDDKMICSHKYANVKKPAFAFLNFSSSYTGEFYYVRNFTLTVLE